MSLFGVACTSACSEREEPQAAAPKAAAQPDAARPLATEHAGEDAGDGGPRADAPEAGPANVPSDPNGNDEDDGAPRVYAKTRFVWIWPNPSSEGQWIGFLWTGGSVRLRDPEPRFGPGCRHWYAVEPRGYVCVDGDRATLDRDDPGYRLARRFAAKLDSPWPHRYGESLGLRRYATPPTPEQQRLREPDLRAHLERVERARSGEVVEALLGVDLARATGTPIEIAGLPRSVHEPRDRIVPRSAVAFTDLEVFAHDRSWLLSADLMWMPKDRIVPYPTVTFRGVDLRKTATLPLAFFRGRDRPRYEKTPEGFVRKGVFARLSWVELSDRQERVGDDTYVQVRGSEDWLKMSEAAIPEPRATTPWGAAVGKPDDSGKAPEGRATWIEVSILGGWLLAYEGTEPVYATLISPGSGGLPLPGRDPLETAATPTGRFTINGKFATATMVAPRELIHGDVPWTQNFSGPYALHGAYWHDDFGQPKSGGCVNVSPIDGRWLFEFTEPKLPEGWHGVRWLPRLEPSTTLLLRR